MSFALGRESLPASWGRYFPPQLLLQVPRWQRRRRLVGTPQSEANELNTVINATSVGRRRRRSPPAIFLTGEKKKKFVKGLETKSDVWWPAWESVVKEDSIEPRKPIKKKRLFLYEREKEEA